MTQANGKRKENIQACFSAKGCIPIRSDANLHWEMRRHLLSHKCARRLWGTYLDRLSVLLFGFRAKITTFRAVFLHTPHALLKWSCRLAMQAQTLHRSLSYFCFHKKWKQSRPCDQRMNGKAGTLYEKLDLTRWLYFCGSSDHGTSCSGACRGENNAF